MLFSFHQFRLVFECSTLFSRSHTIIKYFFVNSCDAVRAMHDKLHLHTSKQLAFLHHSTLKFVCIMNA